MLSGRTVLIVEAQYLIAFDLQNTLDDLAPAQVLIARDAAHAQELLRDSGGCDLAIVEVERVLPENVSFAGDLLRRGVPVIALTADNDLPRNLTRFPDTQILLKPVPTDRVLDAVGKLIQSQKE